jgi:hypothetical protein
MIRKAICIRINNSDFVDEEYMTIGKEYSITDSEYEGFVYVVCDDGVEELIENDCFISLEEYRMERLKELGL